MTESRSVSVAGPVTAERLAQWRAACSASRLADDIWLPSGAGTFVGALRWSEIGDLCLVELAADRFGSRFKPGSAASDCIGVGLAQCNVAEKLVLHDYSRLTMDDSYGMWDNSVLAESVLLKPVNATMLMIPRASMTALKGGNFALTYGMASGRSPALQLLKSLLGTLPAVVSQLSQRERDAIRNTVMELLVAASCDDTLVSKAAVSTDMRQRIAAWIDQRLTHGEICPAEAASDHGISVRSLHRLFSGSGETFGMTVRNRRLARAEADLLHTDDRIQVIAARWGYADASHFIREFKRVHDVPPSSFRLRVGRDATPVHQAS